MLSMFTLAAVVLLSAVGTSFALGWVIGRILL
jgi:Flp pilus assembly protein TadG